jgi:hypothetical protein
LLDLDGPWGVRVVAVAARLWQVGTDNGASSGGRPASGPLVIGTQLAAAREAEARHQAEPRGASPLAGVAYEQGLSLIRFTQVPADEAIDELVGHFAVSSGEDRRGCVRP